MKLILKSMPTIPFTVSARTARLIGQENFANAEGAVIELVKNSYDADASISIIIIDQPNSVIYIFDNGEGMTSDVIKNHWMTIGTDIKQTDFTTKGKRIKTGAKGIGRFALDRLGTICEMTTKTIDNENGLLWKVDWSQFEQKGKKINEINANIEDINNLNLKSEINSIIKGFENLNGIADHWDENKGTILKISGLKDEWDSKSTEELFANLEMLIPPLEENVFSIWFWDKEQIDKFGLVNSARCEDYDYKLSANVDNNKQVKIKIHRNELVTKELKNIGFFELSKLSEELYGVDIFEKGYFEINTSVEKLLPGFKEIDESKNLDKIGPFNFSFYFMKRGGGQEKKDDGGGKYPYRTINYRDRSSWLKEFAGIKIYRDNFRVRPYGETQSSSFDWLGLGQRALKNPTVTRAGYRVRPQQIYGIVNISRIDNINFEDKSSREGLQENNAFILFKELLIAIINKFENDRNQIMMAIYKIRQERDKKEKAKKKAEELIQQRKKEKEEKEKEKKEETTDSKDDEKDIDNEEDEDTLMDAYEAIKDELEELKDEQKLLKVLASAGLIVTSFVHELKNLSDRIVPRTDDLKEILESLIEKEAIAKLADYNNPFIMLADMRSQDERLKHWLDFALAAVRKDKRKRRTINMVEYIEGLERMWSSLLNKKKVELIIDKKQFLEVKFLGFEIDLDGIFNNLIANSVDAFFREDAKDTRRITMTFSFDINTGINLIYKDTGPGLIDEIVDANEILEPFFTTKRDKRTGEKIGTGLGMWIVKSTLDEYKGDIEFISVRDEFNVKIILPHE